MSSSDHAAKLKFIESLLGRGRLARNGKNFDVRCPSCAPRDHDKKKLAIRLSDDFNHCWTCDWKARSLVPLIRKFGTISQLREYGEKFARRRLVPVDDRTASDDVLVLPGGFRMLALAYKSDPDVRAAVKYVTSRGLTERDMWYFKIGVSDDPRWHRRIIVPSFDANGELNYYVGRAIDRGRKPKYDNPDVDKLPIIFNELNIDWTGRLVICEGAFDLFKCGENAVPLLGSTLNEESALFNAILIHSTPVALALDADMATTKLPRLATKLLEYDIDVVVVDVSSYGDPGKMSKSEFNEALLSAKPFDWLSTFKNRLSSAASQRLSVT